MRDANAAYLLGCLLYDNQPENAIRVWEESRRRDNSFALVHRNLALAYAQHEEHCQSHRQPEKTVSWTRRSRASSTNSTCKRSRRRARGPAPEMLMRHHDTVSERDDASRARSDC